MDDFNGIPGAGQSAWSMFALTGGIGYYLLYKELNGEHDGEHIDKRFE